MRSTPVRKHQRWAAAESNETASQLAATPQKKRDTPSKRALRDTPASRDYALRHPTATRMSVPLSGRRGPKHHASLKPADDLDTCGESIRRFCSELSCIAMRDMKTLRGLVDDPSGIFNLAHHLGLDVDHVDVDHVDESSSRGGDSAPSATNPGSFHKIGLDPFDLHRIPAIGAFLLGMQEALTSAWPEMQSIATARCTPRCRTLSCFCTTWRRSFHKNMSHLLAHWAR